MITELNNWKYYDAVFCSIMNKNSCISNLIYIIKCKSNEKWDKKKCKKAAHLIHVMTRLHNIFHYYYFHIKQVYVCTFEFRKKRKKKVMNYGASSAFLLDSFILLHFIYFFLHFDFTRRLLSIKTKKKIKYNENGTLLKSRHKFKKWSPCVKTKKKIKNNAKGALLKSRHK